MKVYLYTVSLVMYVLGSFGFLLPYLFSSNHTELVIAGVVYACLTPIVCFYAIKAICNINYPEVNTNYPGDKE